MNKTIIDAINKNEDIYLRLISDPDFISKNKIFVDEYNSGYVDVTEDLFKNSDLQALIQFTLHYIKERESTNNYEKVKSTVSANDTTFVSAHNEGINTEIQYLLEKDPKGFYGRGVEQKPEFAHWQGKDVIKFSYPYGDKTLNFYSNYEWDNKRKLNIPKRLIGITY